MEPKLIKTEAEHARALAHIETLFDAKPGTPEGDALDLWVTLVELYEEQAFPIPAPDPLAAIRFRTEQQVLKAKDLVSYVGSPSKVSDMLTGKLDVREAAERLPDEAIPLAVEMPDELIEGTDSAEEETAA